MLVNDQTFANVLMMGETLQWSTFDEQKKDIGCWSMKQHYPMPWWWEKFFNDPISMKTKWISDVDKSSNIGECHDDESNSSVISSWWRRKGFCMFRYDQILANVFILSEILRSSHLHEKKKDIRCSSMDKHWKIFSSSEKVFNHLISVKGKGTSDLDEWSKTSECVHRQSNSSLISSRSREKGHRIFVNDQAFVNVMIIREILQQSHPQEE